MDREEFVWRLYESERDFIKHHENQRTNASSIMAATAVGLVVAYSTLSSDPMARLILAIALMIMGVFGTIFSGKLYELIQLHANRSYRYLKEINAAFPDVDVAGIKAQVKKQQKDNFRFFSNISLNGVWFKFHISVFLIGAILTIFSSADFVQWMQSDRLQETARQG